MLKKFIFRWRRNIPELGQVQSYQRSNLALILNLSQFVDTANAKVKYFDKLQQTLGNKVTFDTPISSINKESIKHVDKLSSKS